MLFILPPLECGKVYTAPNLKIVGGTNAAANSWPSIAYIKFNYRGTYSVGGTRVTYNFASACGGTLIDRQVIIKNFYY